MNIIVLSNLQGILPDYFELGAGILFLLGTLSVFLLIRHFMNRRGILGRQVLSLIELGRGKNAQAIKEEMLEDYKVDLTEKKVLKILAHLRREGFITVSGNFGHFNYYPTHFGAWARGRNVQLHNC